MAALVVPENRRSSPRSSVTLATIDTSTAGSTAITENRLTTWTCSRAAARPRRLACTTLEISRARIRTSRRMVAALISRKLTTTVWVGAIGVSPLRTTKVRHADSSAMPPATGTKNRRPDHRRGSKTDGSKMGADVSAWVIQGFLPRLSCWTPDESGDAVMQSYNNVAQLRQIRGVA